MPTAALFNSPESFKISVVNQSALVSQQNYELLVEAVQYQLRHHLCPNWRLKDSVLYRTELGVVSIGPLAYPRSPTVYLVDTAPPVAGTLHEHALDAAGNNISKVYVSTILGAPINGSVLYNPAQPTKMTVSKAFSHEVMEMCVNPYNVNWRTASQANEYMTATTETNVQFYAKEVCDPVYTSSYFLTAGGQKMVMSNFVLPDFFNTQAPNGENFDLIGLKSNNRVAVSPFAPAPGGYIKKLVGTFTANFAGAASYHSTQLAAGTIHAPVYEKVIR
jgi:hypothetical protein